MIDLRINYFLKTHKAYKYKHIFFSKQLLHYSVCFMASNPLTNRCKIILLKQLLHYKVFFISWQQKPLTNRFKNINSDWRYKVLKNINFWTTDKWQCCSIRQLIWTPKILWSHKSLHYFSRLAFCNVWISLIVLSLVVLSLIKKTI